MEIESSLTSSQKTVTGPCPEPSEPGLHPPILFLQDPSKYDPPIYAQIYQSYLSFKLY